MIKPLYSNKLVLALQWFSVAGKNANTTVRAVFFELFSEQIFYILKLGKDNNSITFIYLYKKKSYISFIP